MLRSCAHDKIARSANVARRWAEIGGSMPDDVDLVHHFKTDDMVGIEAYFHNRFRNKRRGGEGFALNAGDVAAFKRRKGIR